MEEILFVIVLLAVFVGLIVVIPIVVVVRTGRLKRESATKAELAQLIGRIYELEQGVERLKALIAQAVGARASEQEAEKPPSPAAKIAPPAPATPPPPGTLSTPPTGPPLGTPAAPPMPTIQARSGAPVTPTLSPRLLGSWRGAGARAPRQWSDLEERLGANWLNKIGIAVFVIGVALFLNYSIRHLGPHGKILVGYLVSVTLIALGAMGERHERYRIGARAVLGGGWAIAYFTTYAMHNVAAVRIVPSAALGFALLFAVAVLMVAHSLRYNSQVATGFAYLLAFASVGVSRITPATLVASAALAASLAAVLSRRGWHGLEPPAILATYALHWMWLRQIFEALGGHRPFPEFKASVALLTLYWLIWMGSYFLRHAEEAMAQRLMTLAFLLNAGGYLAVMRFQSIYPHLRFRFLLTTGAIYLLVSAIAQRAARRTGYLLATTLGAALLAVAVFYKYSGARLELLWLVEAEAFLVAGWRLLDAHLRKLGWLLAAALTVYVMFHDLSMRLEFWKPPDAGKGWMLLALAAGLYLNARLAPRLLREQAVESDRAGATASYAVATGFVLAAAWVALPFMWSGLAWVAVAVALGEWGRWSGDAMLRGCGHGAAVLGTVRVLTINLQYAPPFHGTNLRVLTVALAAALFYPAARRIRLPAAERVSSENLAGVFVRWGGIPATYTGAATLLVTLLIWDEFSTVAVGLGWALTGLVLLEIARAPSVLSRGLRAQGHALVVLSFVRIFLADLNTTRHLNGISARLISVSLLAAIYYYVAFAHREESPRMHGALLWFGAGALGALTRFELVTVWVAVGWAGFAVVAYVAGRRWNEPAMRHQAYLLTALVGLRCAFDNFYQIGEWKFTNARTVTVSIASALLYGLLGVALIERKQRNGARKSAGASAAGATEAGRG